MRRYGIALFIGLVGILSKAALAADTTILGDVVTSSLTVTGPVSMSSAVIGNLTVGSLSGVSVGKVLQVVSCTNATNTSTTGTAFTNSNLSCSITPSSTANKVLVRVSSSLRLDTANVAAIGTISRGATNLMDSTLGGCSVFIDAGGGNMTAGCPLEIYDAPLIAASTTYYMRFRSSNGTLVECPGGAQTQTMTLMEIKN